MIYRDNANQPAVDSVVKESLSTAPLIRGAFRTRDDFPDLMVQWGLTGTGVEVGTYQGAFAAHILANWPGVLYVVDPWTYQPEKLDLLNTPTIVNAESAARQTLARWVNSRPVQRCYIVKQFSVDAAADRRRKHGAKPSVDWVYLDALHDYESVTADLNAWAPLVRSGGVIAGHDYLQYPVTPETVTTFEVVAAVHDWSERNGYTDSDLMTTTEDGFPSFLIRLR